MSDHNSTAQRFYEVEVFYDGGCQLCTKEIEAVRRMDRQRRIFFTDIDAPDFDPARYNKTREALMGKIHGRTGDGWIDGVEVFRRMYAAVGYRRTVALSRLFGISQLLDAGYLVFARNRTRITSRCDADSCATSPAGRR